MFSNALLLSLGPPCLFWYQRTNHSSAFKWDMAKKWDRLIYLLPSFTFPYINWPITEGENRRVWDAVFGTPCLGRRVWDACRHSCTDDWLAQFSLRNIHKGHLKHHHIVIFPHLLSTWSTSPCMTDVNR